ncbi:MAG TPA: acyl-CoA dehydrogenase family protein, partial [Verrucomicrobiae bacterium]|nr:acyl-CoA dehydrogenase family protein [Verrucomicrobiae bacterium]
MNFGFNDEQELLRSTARKFFDNECPSTTVRALMEDSSGMTPELWKKLAEQGWLGLIAPEEHGGMALGIVDLVVLLEEMGRAVVPGPFFST